LACSEWGIKVGSSNGQSKDNPFYIKKMYEFFKANASFIAYENYFNQKIIHQVAPRMSRNRPDPGASLALAGQRDETARRVVAPERAGEEQRGPHQSQSQRSRLELVVEGEPDQLDRVAEWIGGADLVEQ
jgi:hypothetical protein